MVLNAIPITSWFGTPAADPFESIQGCYGPRMVGVGADRVGGAGKASDPIMTKAQPKHHRKMDRRS